MYAVTVAEPGGPEVLRWSEVPDPVPGPGEVLIDVHASAVNRTDLLQRAGRYPPPAGSPPYLSLECAGLVARGPIRTVIDRRLPMTEAADAHRIVEASTHLGKVVLLTPRGIPRADDRGGAAAGGKGFLRS